MNSYCKYILSALLATALITAHADEKETMAKDEATADKKAEKFEERKARQIEKLEAKLACLKTANDKDEMKDCWKQMRKDRKDHRGKSAETDMEADEDMKEKSAEEMKSRRNKNRKNRSGSKSDSESEEIK